MSRSRTYGGAGGVDLQPSGKYIFLRDIRNQRAYKSFYSSDYGQTFRETKHDRWGNIKWLDNAIMLDNGIIACKTGVYFYTSADGGVSYELIMTGDESGSLASSSVHGGEVYLRSSTAVYQYKVQTRELSGGKFVNMANSIISVTLDGVHRYLSKDDVVAVSDDSGATYITKRIPSLEGVSASKDGSIALIRNPQNILLARYDSSGEFVSTGITASYIYEFAAANNKTIVTADSVIRDGVSVPHGSALSTVACSANADIIIGQSYRRRDGVKLRRLVGGEYVEETIPGTAGANWAIAIGG